MLRFTSGYKTTDQSPHHHLLEAQQLGLVHDGEGEAAGKKRDAEEDQHGPEVADLNQTKFSFEFVIYNCPPAGTGTGQ